MMCVRRSPRDVWMQQGELAGLSESLNKRVVAARAHSSPRHHNCEGRHFREINRLSSMTAETADLNLLDEGYPRLTGIQTRPWKGLTMVYMDRPLRTR